MIMMMIGLKITDQYVSFVYFNCGIKKINTENGRPSVSWLTQYYFKNAKPKSHWIQSINSW